MIPSSQTRNILVLNLTRMGDLIQSTPLLMGLRKKYPDARVTLLVGSDFAEFSQRLPEVDERVVFDLKQFNSTNGDPLRSWVQVYRYLEEVLEDLAGRKFDRVYNLSHSKLSAFMISYLGIPEIHGFRCNSQGDRMTEHPWLQYFFTEPFNRPYNKFNLVDIFCRGGDVPTSGQSVQIKVLPEDDSRARSLLQEHVIESGEVLIGIQAGSSLEGRRWPASRFAELADLLVERMNARILLFGVASESPLAAQIIGSMKRPEHTLDLTGKTDIGQLIGLVNRCRYLVTNDTGTMHIAAALGVPIAGLFFAHAHPPETGPYAPGHLIFQANISCAPCSYGVECNNVICIEKVTPGLVAGMLERHQREGIWEVPKTAGSLDEVQIFGTEMDGDSCLRMRPLVQHPLSLQELFAWGYRRLWLDTLTRKEASPEKQRLLETVEFIRNAYLQESINPVLGQLSSKVQNLEHLNLLGEDGRDASEKIMYYCNLGKPDHQALLRYGDKIEDLDERINLVGLTHPEIKPITDMFNKRKENIDGEDLAEMAQATWEGYQKLIQESRGMRDILNFLNTELKPYAACEEAEVVSINMDVPGR